MTVTVYNTIPNSFRTSMLESFVISSIVGTIVHLNVVTGLAGGIIALTACVIDGLFLTAMNLLNNGRPITYNSLGMAIKSAVILTLTLTLFTQIIPSVELILTMVIVQVVFSLVFNIFNGNSNYSTRQSTPYLFA